jgi:hypothetical protein
MKSKLDTKFKESLEGFEMPYDPKAWDAMSKKLDQKFPSGGNGSNLKWFIGGAAMLAAIVSTTVYYSVHETIEPEKTSITAENNSSKTPVDSSVNEEMTNEGVVSSDEPKVNPSTPNEGNIQSPSPNELPAGQKQDNRLNPEKTTPNAGYVPSLPGDYTSSTGTTYAPKPVNLPEIQNICEGESTWIDNKNDVSIYVISPNGSKKEIKPRSKVKFTAEDQGMYLLAQLKDEEIIKSTNFSALPSPAVDMSYDNINIYDKGLPTISMQTTSVGTAFEWNFEGIKKGAFGKEVSAHFFNRGTYNVTLTVTGTNGCSAKDNMKVEVPDDYNLMAVSAFNPNSHIEKNRTFMPHALKERNTPFYLIIIDPSTGGIVYETNDASLPWTGVDKRNGQLVEPNKTYIWKVTLNQPIEGEKSEYKGTVVLQ